MIARDSNGSEAAATFTLIINDGQVVEEDLQILQPEALGTPIPDGSAPNPDTPAENTDGQPADNDGQASNGRASLRDQLVASQDLSIRYTAEQLLQLLLGEIDIDSLGQQPPKDINSENEMEV